MYFWAMFKNILIFVLLGVPGFLLVKTKVLKEEQSKVVSQILTNIGMPFLIFTATINSISFDKEGLVSMGFTFLLGVVFLLGTFLLSHPLTHMEKDIKTRGMMRYCMSIPNNGFLGIPLTLAVFGADSKVFAVVVILNLVTKIMFHIIGAYVISGDKSKISIKSILLNPVIIAFIIGIICNLLKVKNHVPEVLQYSGYFSDIVTPLSMTVLGMRIGNVKLKEIFNSWKSFYVCGIRLIVFPVIIVGITLLLGLVFKSLINGFVVVGVFIAFAMPSAGTATTFADAYKGDVKSAVAFSLSTTVFSVITVPIFYTLVMAFV